MEEVCTVGVPRLDNALDEIAASVDTSCETHADCTRVTIGSECPSTRCPQSMPIARADQERVEASLLEVETTTCEGLQLQNAGCEIEAPSCEPQEPWVPECKAGECTQVSSCDSIAAWLTQQTTDLANSVDRSCTVDEDCYVVRFQTACNRSCSEAAVSAQGRSDFNTLMAEFEPTACSEFELSGCNLQEQSCTLLDPLLACVQGSCVNQ